MKIVICGSMSSAQKMIEIGEQLKENGHSVLLPRHTKEYANGIFNPETQEESAQNKIKDDLIRGYYREIGESDAVLVVNEDKNGIADYIGGNSFLEMGFGYVLEKKVFVLNEIPKISYEAEIFAMEPICLNGDVSKIEP